MKYLWISIATVIIAIAYGLIGDYLNWFPFMFDSVVQVIFASLLFIVMDIILAIVRLIFFLQKKSLKFNYGFFGIFVGIWNLSLFILLSLVIYSTEDLIVLNAIIALSILFGTGLMMLYDIFCKKENQNLE